MTIRLRRRLDIQMIQEPLPTVHMYFPLYYQDHTNHLGLKLNSWQYTPSPIISSDISNRKRFYHMCFHVVWVDQSIQYTMQPQNFNAKHLQCQSILRKLTTIALPVYFMVLSFDYSIHLAIIHVSKHCLMPVTFYPSVVILRVRR